MLLAAVVSAVLVLTLSPVGLSADAAGLPGRTGVDSWVTDLTTDQRLAPQQRIGWRPGPGRAGATIVVDPTRRYQQMVGFGASMTDSSAYVLSRLPAATRRRTMRELFSPTEGIGLSMLRQPMGASDFAVGPAYSYDDQPKGETDPDLSEFSIRHDRAYILPRLREAYALNPRLTFMATPWSPPGWMKTTDSMIGGSLQERYHQAYADYFVKFVRAYRRAGIPTDYVSMQNEPLYTPPDYPGTWVLPDQAATFIGRHLGPALSRAGLDTEILGYDHNWDIADYPEALYADRRATRQIAGTAWHCYAGDVVAQSVSHNNYPHAQAFQTECSGGAWQSELGDPFALTMASVIGVPRNWGQSVVLWNLALDERNGPFIGGCDVCRGVVTVNDDGTVTRELDYWALGHASRFVRPGAVRIGSSSLVERSAEGGLTNVAFANRDGSHVLIAHNGENRARSVDVQVGARHFRTTLAPGAAATYRWVGRDRISPAGDLGWVDLDYGRGPAGTPGDRLIASVSPEVVDALTAVKLQDRWLAYSLPYGAALQAPGPVETLSRAGWRITPVGATPVEGETPAGMIDGDPRTRWSSGTGQNEELSLTLDLGGPQTFTEIVLDSRASLGDYLRRYRVQISDDGVAWTEVARGPGRAGEMVIALPPTTTRYLRLVSGGSSASPWSIHELNLRRAGGEVPEVVPGPDLVGDRGVLLDGTEVAGFRNTGRAPAAVPWPVPGLGYRYFLPPTAAVTFALLSGPPRLSVPQADQSRDRTGS